MTANVLWNFPGVITPGQYDRLLLQQTGPTTPYNSVTLQQILSAGFDASLGKLSATGRAMLQGGVVVQSGATSSRPASPVTGQHYLDTTLSQPIWYIAGTGWVNAAGVVV